MPAPILLLSLAVTCSTLRIQQKEKDTAALRCTDSTITDDCECFLKGYGGGGNIGSCTAQDQALAALELNERVRSCVSGFSCNWYDPGQAFWPDCSATDTTVNRYWELTECLVKPGDNELTKGIPLSSRAILNPTGLIPKRLSDPIEEAAIQAQLASMTLSKQADSPGSPPIGLCVGMTRSDITTPITVCDENTNMFDGLGMCCSTKHNPDELTDTKEPTNHDSSGATDSWAGCYGESGVNDATDTGLVHYNPGTADSPLNTAWCYSNVHVHRCQTGSSGSYTDCTTAGCVNGGLTTTIGKFVQVCT